MPLISNYIRARKGCKVCKRTWKHRKTQKISKKSKTDNFIPDFNEPSVHKPSSSVSIGTYCLTEQKTVYWLANPIPRLKRVPITLTFQRWIISTVSLAVSENIFSTYFFDEFQPVFWLKKINNRKESIEELGRQANPTATKTTEKTLTRKVSIRIHVTDLNSDKTRTNEVISTFSTKVERE